MTVRRFQTNIKKASQPLVDFLLGKTMSKKLTVFLIGTIGWFKGMLVGSEWLILSGIYIFGLLYLNHMENMAKFKKEVQQTFQGTNFVDNEDIGPKPGEEDNKIKR